MFRTCQKHVPRLLAFLSFSTDSARSMACSSR
jgi:hypothetical protein